MTSIQGIEKMFANLNMAMFDVDADYSTAAVVTATEIDMRDHFNYVVIAMVSALTGTGIVLLEIVGYTTAGGTGSITQIKTSGAVLANAVGDYVALECSAEELRQEAEDAGAELRYCATRLTNNNAGDEAVAFVMAVPRFAASGKTATYIS